MQAQHTSSVLVRDGERLGILTNTGLQRAIVDGRPLAQLPVRSHATFELVTITPQAPLFDALALMIQHQVHRLVVADDERHRRPAGTARPAELSVEPLVPDHRADRAARAISTTLRGAAARITGLVALLYRGGTRVGQIGRLVQALNAKLFERTWQLVAPPELQAASCLFVMGSEGRGEQLLKTDQDNGLILRDDAALDEAAVAAACERFSAALRDFGYPDCPGGIMVSRPAWRHRQREFAATVRQWLLRPDPRGPDGVGDLHRCACGGRRCEHAGRRARRGRRPGGGERRAARPLRGGDRLRSRPRSAAGGTGCC